MRIPISKIDVEQRRVFGWASIISDESGANLIFDHQETMIPIAELENAAYEYVQKSRDGGDMHERRGLANLIASIVMTPEIRKAMDLPPGKIGWFVGFDVPDETLWRDIKSGERPELSIGGSAVKEPVA